MGQVQCPWCGRPNDVPEADQNAQTFKNKGHVQDWWEAVAAPDGEVTESLLQTTYDKLRATTCANCNNEFLAKVKK